MRVSERLGVVRAMQTTVIYRTYVPNNKRLHKPPLKYFVVKVLSGRGRVRERERRERERRERERREKREERKRGERKRGERKREKREERREKREERGEREKIEREIVAALATEWASR